MAGKPNPEHASQDDDGRSRTRIAESTVIERAASRGVRIYGMSPYFLTQPSRRGLMLGYSRMKEPDIREAVRRLSEVLL